MLKINSIFLLCFGVIIPTHYLVSAEECNVNECASYCEMKKINFIDENGLKVDNILKHMEMEESLSTLMESVLKDSSETCTEKVKDLKIDTNAPKCFKMNFVAECFVKLLEAFPNNK